MTATQRHAHASGLHVVAATLDDLHHDMLRTGGAEADHVRLSVHNIVAACNDRSLLDGAVETVVSVAERHPARAIVIFANRNGEAVIESDISLRQSEAGTNIELVRLEVRGEPALHLASIVQPLLVPDIPVHLWLAGAPPLDQAFRADALELCERLILDTAAYPDAVATLAAVADEPDEPDAQLTLGDLAWERLRPWRAAIAHAFDGPSLRPWLRGITSIEVVGSGHSVAVEAWLIGGWVSSRIGWPPDEAPAIDITAMHEHGGQQRQPELSAVRIHCHHNRHEARVDVERRGQVLHTAIEVDDGVVASRATTLPPWTEAQLIARLLVDAGDAPVYRGAVREALTLAQRSP